MKLEKFLFVLFGSFAKLEYGLANEPMAVFYENGNKSGRAINYFEETDDYGHIQVIVDKRDMSGIALLCATGVFILYNQEEFDSDYDEEVSILGGKETCIPPGSVNSIMFAQSYANTTLDSITVFSTERFGGEMPLKINAQTENKEASLIQMGQIKSFILMGTSKWTIITRYRTFCIKSGESSDYPICPVPYTNAFFFEEELNWLSAKKGCEEGTDTKIISLNYCFNHGSGKLEPISSNGTTQISPEIRETRLTARRAGNVKRPLESCGDIDEFSLLLKIRLTHDFDSLYQVQFPFNKAHSWRAEILDYTMEIVDTCIIDDLVDRRLLRYVREMYIYFAEKVVWAEGKGWPSKPRQRVLLVAHETSRCLTHMTNKNWVDVPIKLSEQILRKIETPRIKDSDIDPVFMPVKGYDLVMELIWLSINYVGAACHAALEYETDFWMDYMSVAYDMYLRPMAEYWGKPGAVLNYYPIILGGFGVDRQHRGLAAATTSLYQAVSLDKLQRPVEVKNTASG